MKRRSALVTGGASGIGRAVAEALQREDFDVAVCGRRRERLSWAEAAGMFSLECDVRSPDVVSATVDQVLAQFGRLDVLVNSAGVISRHRVEEMPLCEIERIIATNLLGTVYVSQSSIPSLKRSRGSIVNVSSTLVQNPIPGTAMYAASKAGVEAFSRALAIELAADHVRVNVVSPATVRSEIWLAAGMGTDEYDAYLARRAKEYPLGRVGEPADVAAAVCFLVSDAASWITGVVLPIDGGRLIGLAPETGTTAPRPSES